ncbi:MAG: hypothetical protein ACETWC_06700 [Acidobacteriota bacterium]
MFEKEEFPEREKQQPARECSKDPLSAIFSGLIVILLGVLFLLVTQDYLRWGDWWAYLLVGIGIIFVIEVIVRQTRAQYRCPIAGKLIGGLVLIAVGAGHIYGLRHWWPLVIIVVGFVIMFMGFKKLRGT